MTDFIPRLVCYIKFRAPMSGPDSFQLDFEQAEQDGLSCCLRVKNMHSKPINVWSHGYIFAELVLWKPFFLGNDNIDQLAIISEKLGKLSDTDLDFVASVKEMIVDNGFETVHSGEEEAPPNWVDLLTFSSLRSPLDPEDAPTLANEWLNPTELAQRRMTRT